MAGLIWGWPLEAQPQIALPQEMRAMRTGRFTMRGHRRVSFRGIKCL